MYCRLCLQENPLLKQSHIIPNFLYRGLYGADNYLVDINLHKPVNKRKVQTGYFDKQILCADCDNRILGSLEHYAKNHFYDAPPESSGITRQPVGSNSYSELPVIRYTNIDADRIKLFFLSILWKAGISSHPFFEKIDLGTKYSERIRQMIITGDAGEIGELKVVPIIVVAAKDRPVKSIIQPLRYKDAGNTFHIFHIDTVMYHFNISNYNKLPLFDRDTWGRDWIDVGIIQGDFANEYFDRYLGKFR